MKHLNGCPFFKCHKLFLLGRSFVSGLLQVSRAIAVASCPVVVFADTLPFEATQMAIEFQKEASPVVIADSQSDVDEHPSVRRSLVVAFSDANPSTEG